MRNLYIDIEKVPLHHPFMSIFRTFFKSHFFPNLSLETRILKTVDDGNYYIIQSSDFPRNGIDIISLKDEIKETEPFILLPDYIKPEVLWHGYFENRETILGIVDSNSIILYQAKDINRFTMINLGTTKDWKGKYGL